MEYITLKNSILKVSRLCMGGCPMGGYGWGNVQENELIHAVQSAIDNGITIFDTADTYGLGQSEITLSKALGTKRNSVVIADKFGVRVENGKTFYDNSPEYIKVALDRSLKRLKTDYIDLYQVHYRDATPLDIVIETLERIKESGKIRYYGLSNIHETEFEEIKPFVGKIVSVQDEYSLACRKNESDLYKLSKNYSISPLTWGSLGQGVLTGKYDKTIVFGSDDRRSRDIYVNFHGDKLVKNLEIVDVMKKIAIEHNKPIPAVAIRFILDKLGDSVVLVGAKRPAQISENIEGTDWNLTVEELELLDNVSKDKL
ncbi:MAG: aldo/keto reductase [Salinivirgaceae bacterium]|nr:aldo/keto reductase [Salinivirgaceae bacterium]